MFSPGETIVDHMGGFGAWPKRSSVRSYLPSEAPMYAHTPKPQMTRSDWIRKSKLKHKQNHFEELQMTRDVALNSAKNQLPNCLWRFNLSLFLSSWQRQSEQAQTWRSRHVPLHTAIGSAQIKALCSLLIVWSITFSIWLFAEVILRVGSLSSWAIGVIFVSPSYWWIQLS